MRRLLLVLVLASTAVACGQPRSTEVFVGSASSFAHAVTSIGDIYDDYDVSTLLAGSQTLVTQVLDDAPIDVIITADRSTMERLVQAGKTAAPPALVARNRLAIGVERGNPHDIRGLGDLAQPELKLVLASREVPLGAYSEALLRSAGVTVVPVSLTNNANAVAGLISGGEADAGLVYATDADVWRIDTVAIPEEENVPTEYYVAPLVDAPNPNGASDFTAFLLSSAGQDVLRALGYRV